VSHANEHKDGDEEKTKVRRSRKNHCVEAVNCRCTSALYRSSQLNSSGDGQSKRISGMVTLAWILILVLNVGTA
jgi:hypothetical protein